MQCNIELDAVGRQLEPYPYRRMRLHAGGTLVVWPGMLFPNSGIKAAANLRLNGFDTETSHWLSQFCILRLKNSR